MSDTGSNDDILGFIPKSKYVTIAYYLMLGSCVIGLLGIIMVFGGIPLGLGKLATLAMVLSLIMVLAGLFAFPEQLSEFEQGHLKYIGVIFAILFVLGLVIGLVFGKLPLLVFLITIVMSIVQLVVFYTGFNSYKKGRTITKDNLKSEVQLAVKRA